MTDASPALTPAAARRVFYVLMVTRWFPVGLVVGIMILLFTGRGLTIPRRFTQPGVHPFDAVEWELRSATIINELGQVVFEQRDVEIPKAWSQTATNVVVSKYFRGALGTPWIFRDVSA